ncbi:MAG: SDR family oxidoreductase, partial [Myxococcota bacterium]
DIARAVQTNLTGAMMLVNAFVPKMRVKSKVVLLNSILGQIPLMGNAAYCATKAGLHHFAESLSIELERAGRGVKVHSLYPAYVKTPMLESVQDGGRTFLKPVEPDVVTRQIARIVNGKVRDRGGFISLRDKFIAGFYRFLPGSFRSLLASM